MWYMFDALDLVPSLITDVYYYKLYLYSTCCCLETLYRQITSQEKDGAVSGVGQW